MSDIVIHNIRVSYDESHERVRNFVEYLKNPDRKEELKAYYDETKSSGDHKIHLNDKNDNEFTLICDSNHNCTLRLRGI
ncbi:MAG: hypothetical protein UT09_C0007G0028 [Parcubacteria group bacterium GW2011_GWF2_38_8]|nr:MAG: hypothetical protein UT09_C0007G0028 [Parcubacteria group bacterium GW2011_GWF2_38_8]